MTIKTYDYHGAWDPFTGLNAPLFSNPNIDIGDDVIFNAVRLAACNAMK